MVTPYTPDEKLRGDIGAGFVGGLDDVKRHSVIQQGGYYE
jgi:hypothetical protein